MSGPVDGWVDLGLETEFPGLSLAVRECDGPVRVDPGVQERLASIASRIRGRTAIELRREPVPAAYRAFYRQVGLDPDVEMTPVEAAVGRRLFDGGVRTPGPLTDALELAVLETCIPVYALDPGALDGPPGIRPARPGEQLVDADGARRSSPGRLVIADAAGALCWLFGEAHGRGAPGPSTAPILLAAVAVPGVPPMGVDEALDIAAGALGA